MIEVMRKAVQLMCGTKIADMAGEEKQQYKANYIGDTNAHSGQSRFITHGNQPDRSAASNKSGQGGKNQRQCFCLTVVHQVLIEI